MKRNRYTDPIDNNHGWTTKASEHKQSRLYQHLFLGGIYQAIKYSDPANVKIVDMPVPEWIRCICEPLQTTDYAPSTLWYKSNDIDCSINHGLARSRILGCVDKVIPLGMFMFDHTVFEKRAEFFEVLKQLGCKIEYTDWMTELKTK